MAFSLSRPPRWRYVVPVGAVAVTLAVAVPQLASGADHPPLPPRTAAQLLSSLHRASLPQFTGTVVATTDLGLPDISSSAVNNFAPDSASGVSELMSLLTGSHTAELAYGGPQRQRVALFIKDLSETDLIHNGRNLWTYSSGDNSVSHTRLPADSDTASAIPDHVPAAASADPKAAAQKLLARIDPSTAVSVQRTAEVAGRSAYQLVLRPRSADSLIRSVSIAVDSATSLPLRVQVWARGVTTDPAFQVAFTSLHIGVPSASTFDFTTPHGAVMKSNPLAPTRTLHRVRVAPPGGPFGHSASRAPGPKRGVHTRVVPKLEGGTAKPKRARQPAMHVAGKGWTAVVEGRLPTGKPDAGGTAGELTGLLHNLASPVPGGRLLRTNLLSAFITNDGRYYIGAVTPAYLERLAQKGAAR